MIRKLLRKIGLGRRDAAIADSVLEEVADRVTGGVSGDVIDVAEQAIAVVDKVKRRRAAKPSNKAR